MAAFEGSRSSAQQGPKAVLLHQAVPRLMRAMYRDLNDGIALSAAYRAGLSSTKAEGDGSIIISNSSSSSSSSSSNMKGDRKSLTYGEVQVESFMQVCRVPGTHITFPPILHATHTHTHTHTPLHRYLSSSATLSIEIGV